MFIRLTVVVRLEPIFHKDDVQSIVIDEWEQEDGMGEENARNKAATIVSRGIAKFIAARERVKS
jgi:hypothetical protein